MNYPCLIVEDELLIRKNLCKKMSQYPALFSPIWSARNGYEAIELIKHADSVPALIITDIQMPVMDGLALAEHISHTYPQTKILILSGYSDFYYAQQAIRYNVCDYLLKPITDEVLYESLLSIKMQLDSLPHEQWRKTELPAEINFPESIVADIQNYICQHYTENISLEDLANRFRFSPAHIRKIFKQYTQYTPSQYLTHLRIAEAKRLLLTQPQLTIATIGVQIGYPDPYYFSRIFKKSTGLYPTEYRSVSSAESTNFHSQ